MSDGRLLTRETVAPYLVERGVLARAAGARVDELAGGVSSGVFAVAAGGRGLVVKQALPRLRVKADWRAKRERAMTEGAALTLAGELVPGAVPDVHDIDGDAFALTIAHAPVGWRTWKESLLALEADPGVAAELGRLIGTVHARTLCSAEVARRFADAETFRQLRLDPYYAEVARKHAGLSAAVGALAAALRFHRRCLVHGDFSPKNVLVGPEGLWLVDWEVAHLGDPAFDVAFMLHHLVLKAVHRPEASAAFAHCGEEFWRAYGEQVPVLVTELEYVLCHVGCLLLARVDGKSPAEYLTPAGQMCAGTLGVGLLRHPAPTLADLWLRLETER